MAAPLISAAKYFLLPRVVGGVANQAMNSRAQSLYEQGIDPSNDAAVNLLSMVPRQSGLESGLQTLQNLYRANTMDLSGLGDERVEAPAGAIMTHENEYGGVEFMSPMDHYLRFGGMDRDNLPDTQRVNEETGDVYTPVPPGYADGGAVKSSEEMTDEEYLARLKGLRPRQRAKPSSEEAKRAVNKQLPELIAEYLLPQDAVDLGLMVLPGGKIARKVGAGLIAGGATTEAEAGAAKKLATTGLAKLRELLQRESPEQAAAVRQALRESARTGKEVSVIGAADRPVGGRLVVGEREQVIPSAADRSASLLSDRPILDMHTHPQGTMGVRPSKEDFAYYRDNYGSQVRSGATPRELRTLIAQPPEPDIRARAAYNFFATDKPLAVFDPRRIDDARYELQRGAARGKFRSVQDDPLMREYFEYGGDIADLMDEAAALALLRHRAAEGKGRHELVLGGRSFTPNREASEQRFFDMITPEMLELFRAKKLARGGAVNFDPDEIAQMAEHASHGYAAGGLVDYDPNEIDTIVSRLIEEFHG